MLTEIKCPQCHELTPWQGNPHRPFCSERCRLIDLGQWADESYRVPGPPHEPFEFDNVVFIDKEEQGIER